MGVIFIKTKIMKEKTIINPNDKKIKKLIEDTEKIAEEWAKLGVNMFQPGAIKELKIAQKLGHLWVSSKHDADACDVNDRAIEYEYLSGAEGGSGQIDRFFKDDPYNEKQHKKYLKSMERVDRNNKFFLTFNNPKQPLDIVKIYEIPTQNIKEEVNKQLQKSSNNISHISFNEKFGKENGTLIWSK